MEGSLVMWLWLAPSLAAVAGVAYWLGYRRGTKLWRHEQWEKEVERRLLNQPPQRRTGPPSVVRSARIVSTKNWRR